MSNDVKVVSFAEVMGNLTEEQFKHNLLTWQTEQRKLKEKQTRKDKEMFNRPMAKALAMVRANKK